MCRLHVTLDFSINKMNFVDFLGWRWWGIYFVKKMDERLHIGEPLPLTNGCNTSWNGSRLGEVAALFKTRITGSRDAGKHFKLLINPTTTRYSLNWATRGQCFYNQNNSGTTLTTVRTSSSYNRVITSVLSTVYANGQFSAVKFSAALISFLNNSGRLTGTEPPPASLISSLLNFPLRRLHSSLNMRAGRTWRAGGGCSAEARNTRQSLRLTNHFD